MVNADLELETYRFHQSRSSLVAAFPSRPARMSDEEKRSQSPVPAQLGCTGFFGSNRTLRTSLSKRVAYLYSCIGDCPRSHLIVHLQLCHDQRSFRRRFSLLTSRPRDLFCIKVSLRRRERSKDHLKGLIRASRMYRSRGGTAGELVLLSKGHGKRKDCCLTAGVPGKHLYHFPSYRPSHLRSRLMDIVFPRL